MKRIIAIPALLFGLLLSANAQTAPIPMNDGFYDIFDPARINDYEPNVVVGGTEIWTAGFGFTDDSHEFVAVITLPSNFIGELVWQRSAGPDGTGLYFGGGSLSAGESISLDIGGVASSSVANPHDEWLSFQALDMPPLSSVPTTNPSAVPVPAAVWLFGSGLLGLVGMARRKKA